MINILKINVTDKGKSIFLQVSSNTTSWSSIFNDFNKMLRKLKAFKNSTREWLWIMVKFCKKFYDFENQCRVLTYLPFPSRTITLYIKLSRQLLKVNIVKFKANDVILVSLLLTLNIFRTLFLCFYC